MAKTNEDRFPELYNTTIDDFFHTFIKNPHYVDALCKDQLKDLPVEKMFCLVNSQPLEYKGPDRHWTMIYLIDPNYAIIFDSYGVAPDQDILNYVKKVAKKFNLTIASQNSQLQTFGSNSCGWYCCFMILKLLKGETYRQALNHFTEKNIDTQTNEKYLYNYFKDKMKFLTGKQD